MVLSRAPASPFGEMPALLTSALQASTLRLQALLHLGDGAQGVAGIGEVDLDVILRPHLPGAVLGEGWREQVMTRQPAEAKRFTVAWPMPREAPVRISVLRSALGTVVMPQAISLLQGSGQAQGIKPAPGPGAR